METIKTVLEWISFVLEIFAVLVIVTGIVIATFKGGLFKTIFQLGQAGLEPQYKQQVGNGLLIGLDLLIAADIIRTVSLDQTLYNMATLGLLVIIRIILTWSIMLEIDGHWPWQNSKGDKNG